jgi:hypothetical protein
MRRQTGGKGAGERRHHTGTDRLHPAATAERLGKSRALLRNNRLSLTRGTRCKQESKAFPEEETIETTGQVTRRTRGRSRIIVERRSFLDAGRGCGRVTAFLDYAFPLHRPMDVVINTGGRTGWHNWPLPGPLFPSAPELM